MGQETGVGLRVTILLGISGLGLVWVYGQEIGVGLRVRIWGLG
jgi:hypothetical protein